MSDLLRIDRLAIKNFRCFSECLLELHPKLTVLVAENGQGKTALLHGLRLGLDPVVAGLGRSSLPQPFQVSDIHRAFEPNGVVRFCLPVSFEIDGQIDGRFLHWNRALLDNSGTTMKATFKGVSEVREISKALSRKAESASDNFARTEQILPVVAYYGTGRLYNDNYLTAEKRWLAKISPSPISAYLDCLSPASSYKAFEAWFGEKWEQTAEPTSRAAGFHNRPENQLAAVREAVHTVLSPTGWGTIAWQFAQADDDGRYYAPSCIIMEHATRGILPLSFLSDGIRNMVALVGDLAHRCVRLNSQLGESAAKETPGTVLIDELDMHLHPSWQQKIVGLLQEAFPRIQFVVTTHSPHLLTTVRRESIRILNRNDDGIWKVDLPDDETKGIESSTALSDVMGVNQMPPVVEAGWRNDYTALIENGVHESTEGLELRAKLVTHYGEQHPIILDFDRLIRFQAFKRRNPRPSE